MINIEKNREKFILRPTVPTGTYYIDYKVKVMNETMFLGSTKYFGAFPGFTSEYEVDCEDWIESYMRRSSSTVLQVVVTVEFTFLGYSKNEIGQQTMTCSWSPNTLFINKPDISTAPCIYLQLINSGFVHQDVTGHLYIPLSVKNGILEGRTINNLEKVNYIDRYGDEHNGGMTNKYELECYVDPCWLYVKTGDDNSYEKVMLALQNAQSTTMYVVGADISGIYNQNHNSTWSLSGKVKDIELVETYSSYSVERKIPTYKITFEVYK